MLNTKTVLGVSAVTAAIYALAKPRYGKDKATTAAGVYAVGALAYFGRRS